MRTKARMMEFQAERQVKVGEYLVGNIQNIVGPPGEICTLYFYSELSFLLMNNIPLVPADVEKLVLSASAPGPVLS